MIGETLINKTKKFTMKPKIKIWAQNGNSFAVTILYPNCWNLKNKDDIMSKEYIEKNFKNEKQY